MDFFDRFALYAEAVGLQDIAVAWDFAHLPMGDAEHYDLASKIGGWE